VRSVTRDPIRGLAVFALLGVATVALTWPVAVSLDDSFATHADYFSNIWNLWWVRHSLWERGASPYWTDYLFFPDGISLAVHTLSLANSVPGALLGAVFGATAAFNLLTLAHFWLGAWALYLLAHEVTGSRWGSLLAGLVYAFCPFHYYYLPMINIVSMESLPLAALFFLRTYRDGGIGNGLAAAAFTALTGISCWYYLPYVALLAGALTACGRLWAPEVPFRTGLRRVAAAGVGGAVLVMPLAWPVISASLFARAEHPKIGRHLHEGHDLLGFFWVGPPEQRILAWPAALGYSALLLVTLGFREVRQQTTWLLLLAAAWVLSLGGTLRVGGTDTGLPLPYAALVELPVLGMLRNPDRMFLLVQLGFAVLCAFGWKGLAARIGSPGARAAVAVAMAAAVMLEFSGAPLRRFAYRCSPLFAELARDPGVETLIELPLSTGHYAGRFNYCQTLHEKKIPEGYVTNLAMTPELHRSQGLWRRSVQALRDSRPDEFLARLRTAGIDRVVLNKTVVVPRTPPDAGPVIWQPFGRIHRHLMPPRQTGAFRFGPVGDQPLRAALQAALGDPLREDESIVVFPAP
jgi:hypothetical protein